MSGDTIVVLAFGGAVFGLALFAVLFAVVRAAAQTVLARVARRQTCRAWRMAA